MRRRGNAEAGETRLGRVRPKLLCVAAFSALARASGSEVDSDRLATVQEAAAISDLVAQGTVVSIDEGRAFIVQNDNPSVDALSLVLGVRIDRAIQGSLAKNSDGIAYIEIHRTRQTSVAEYKEALPEGTAAALYLNLLPQEAAQRDAVRRATVGLPPAVEHLPHRGVRLRGVAAAGRGSPRGRRRSG